MAVATGKSLTAWQTDTKPALAEEPGAASCSNPPRAELYDRCDARLGLMVEHGALDEVRAMEARGLDPSLPALKAVGYRELARASAGRDLAGRSAGRRPAGDAPLRQAPDDLVPEPDPGLGNGRSLE